MCAPPLTRSRLRTLTALSLVAVMLWVTLAGALALPRPPYLGPPPGFTALETNHVRVLLQHGAPITPSAFAVAYGSALDRAYAELIALFPAPPLRPELTVYATEANLTSAIAPAPVTAPVLADTGPTMLVTALPLLETLSPLEAENALRHALALAIVERAAGGQAPPLLAAGIAAYVERPVSARLARVAALLQNANRQNELIAWDPLLASSSPGADPALEAAHAYSLVAFLAERFGVGRLGDFVIALREYPTWQAALRETYQRSSLEVEQEWRTNLPQWTAAGWQTNLIAAFDLQPARDLLARAHYAAAKEEIGKSLRLATELGDPARLAEAEVLQRQSDIGLQAESLMAQTEAALTGHDYQRAAGLTRQARGQFAQLPPTQRLDELLTQYEAIAATGLQANQDLAHATALAPVWTNYPAARAAALAAGRAAANLGNETLATRAQDLLDEIDSRQRRIVLLLLVLSVITFAWLAVWRRSRGPGELDWR